MSFEGRRVLQARNLDISLIMYILTADIWSLKKTTNTFQLITESACTAFSTYLHPFCQTFPDYTIYTLCNLNMILAFSCQSLLPFVYFNLPLIPLLFANTGVLRPLGSKENTVCLHPRMPRRSSLPYDTATLSSLLDPLTVPTGNITVLQLLHGAANSTERGCF